MSISFPRFPAIAGALLLTATGAGCGQAAGPSHSTLPTGRRATVLKIVPVPVKQDDEANLLDLSMWRFEIAGPKPAHRITFIVEERAPGKPARRLVTEFVEPGIGWPLNSHLSIFVGSYPLNDNLRSAAKAKYVVRVDGFRASGLRSFGAKTDSAYLDNPFSGMEQMDTFDEPKQNKDGGFVLISGSRQSIATQRPLADVELVFRVQEEAY